MAGTRRVSKRQRTRAVAQLARNPAQRAVGPIPEATQPGIDMLRTNVETFQRAVTSTMDFMAQMVEQNANGPGRVSETSTSSKRLGNGEAANTMTGALTDIWGEWVSLMQKCARHNVDHWKVFFSSRTPQDFVRAQTELLRGDMEDVLESGRRIAEKSIRLSSVGRSITANAERFFPPPDVSSP